MSSTVNPSPELLHSEASEDDATPSGGMHWAAWMLQALPPFVGSRVINRVLRAAGARISKSVSFWGCPRIYGDMHRYLEIGPHCGFNVGCVFQLGANITIEECVSVGHEVVFRGSKPIRIGSGAWLGARCVIGPGVSVGPGAVIGAGTVVTADVPENLMLSGSRKVSLARWR